MGCGFKKALHENDDPGIKDRLQPAKIAGDCQNSGWFESMYFVGLDACNQGWFAVSLGRRDHWKIDIYQTIGDFGKAFQKTDTATN